MLQSGTPFSEPWIHSCYRTKNRKEMGRELTGGVNYKQWTPWSVYNPMTVISIFFSNHTKGLTMIVIPSLEGFSIKRFTLYV